MAIKTLIKKQALKQKGLSKVTKKATKKENAVKQQRVSHERGGTGLKFEAELYEVISRLTGKTKIKYAPNPKTPGSKSYERYKKYEKCKTVAEALKYCKPADLLWEHQRDYLKIIGGPMADKPACMQSPEELEKDPARKILAKFRGPRGCSIKMDPEVRAKLTSFAAKFGMDLDKIHEEAGKACNDESADIQTARIIANEIARRKLQAKSGIKITDKDIVDVLSVWGFPENETRLNVLPDGVKTVHSDTLGVLKMRDGTYRIFDATARYEFVTKLICKWFADNKPKDIPEEFGFTGININHNYAGRRHRDNGNEGPSAIKAIGNFTGGKLNYFPKDVKKPGRGDVMNLKAEESIPLDLSKKFVLFNGNNAHGVQPFKGTRFSLVFFTTSKWFKVQDPEVKKLKELGFVVPTLKGMSSVKEVSSASDIKRANLVK